jgi:hypothetical protein
MLLPRLTPVALFALAVAALVPFAVVAPAAPVPRHLMPKEEPVCYPTRVGDRHVSRIGDFTIVCVVAKAERTADGLLVRTENEQPDGTRTHNETALVSARGVKVIEYAGNKLDEPFWWVKLPHAEDNTWSDVWVGQTRNWKTAGWEDVEVPAGKFRAIRIDREDGAPGAVTTYWFAPGMGCVKWSSGTGGRELTEFKPGK